MKLNRTLDLDVIKARTEANYEVWGPPSTKEEYVQKTMKNANVEGYIDEKSWYYYVLENEETKVNESSVEALFRAGWVKKGGLIHEVTTAVIGSVYTDQQFRGKNNVGVMMNQLDKDLKQRGVEIQFLYSEIGEYYARFGFKSCPIKVWKFEGESIDIDQYQLISRKDKSFQYIVDNYSEILKNRLKEGSFCLKPQIGIFEWFFNRSCMTSENKVGYSIEGGYIVWNWGDNELQILLLHAENSNALKILVEAARGYAHLRGLKYVKMWDLNNDVKIDGYLNVLNELGGTCMDNTSLSAIKYNKDQDLEWIANEMWCWF